ncbi:MAG: RsmD family RNA methyltransferase [Propionicimonas sp.]|uniref:RsmD family RNA methyltransferase n=1 Tax=Propionicimonas sp. TaxID=1955623 RepID=UPI003D09F48B
MTRIIAGSRKGHRLRTPAHDATRPTTDRVREAAFSLVADWAGTLGEPADSQLAGLAFLDLYAGSGAVALEAASRGAAPVWAVESDAGTARIARGNATELRLPLTVRAQTVEATLATEPPQRFDVVWADPPYALSGERLAPVLAAVAERWLATDGLLVVERSTRDLAPVWPSELCERWERRYGETTLYFARRPTG